MAQDVELVVVGEELVDLSEDGNVIDQHAVAIIKGDEIVGHIPRFLFRGGPSAVAAKESFLLISVVDHGSL